MNHVPGTSLLRVVRRSTPRAASLLTLALLACSAEPASEPGADSGTGAVPGAGGSIGGTGTGGSASGVGGASASGGSGGSVGGSTATAGAGGSSTGAGGVVSAGAGGVMSAGGTGGLDLPAAGAPGSGGTGGSESGAGSGGSGAEGGTAGPGGGAGGDTGGSSAGSGGGAVAGTGGAVTFSRPKGTIPNKAQPTSVVNLPKDQWQKGLISPSMQNTHQINQPAINDGYLLIGGNEEFWLYDVSNPASPRQLSSFTTPGRTGQEAESHTLSFARYGDTFYVATISGKGIDTWDITNAASPKHVGALKITGVNYGDYTEAVWGVTWQGQYIYVGATNNGIKVVDAADPAALKLAGEVPTSQYGGVSAGPLDAVGNVLVVMTPKENGGLATLDISDPVKPTRLASISVAKAYIGQFYRHYAFFIGLNAFDVLTNPRSIATTPLGHLATEGSEYMTFSDDSLFLGHLRTEIGGTPGASKINVADPRNMKVTSRIWGRLDKGALNDDQFTFPFGNLLVIGDDQSPYPGWVIAAHQADPDTKPPVVDTVIPNDKATGVSVKSRIGISFSDNIELATVNGASLIVRPVGGQPLPGRFGARMGVVNFDPDQDLQPGTTYEVVLPQGGLTDLVGNAIATEWKSTFTTN